MLHLKYNKKYIVYSLQTHSHRIESKNKARSPGASTAVERLPALQSARTLSLSLCVDFRHRAGAGEENARVVDPVHAIASLVIVASVVRALPVCPGLPTRFSSLFYTSRRKRNISFFFSVYVVSPSIVRVFRLSFSLRPSRLCVLVTV